MEADRPRQTRGRQAPSRVGERASARQHERYEDVDPNPVKIAAAEPVSTFSIDVDTASYSNVRRFLHEGTLPPRDAVRIEEMVNYFDYAYDLPEGARRAVRRPRSPSCPRPGTRHQAAAYRHQGLRHRAQPSGRARNLVFLIDVSGSMESADKLPLVKQTAERLLVRHLDSATASRSSSMPATPAPCSSRPAGLDTRQDPAPRIDNLQAGGSTAGGEGIRQAYALAERNFDRNAVNRVILADRRRLQRRHHRPERARGLRRPTSARPASTCPCSASARGNYNDDADADAGARTATAPPPTSTA